MQLNLEPPDYRYFLRGADGASALVNEQRLLRSFIVAPDALVEDWPVADARCGGRFLTLDDVLNALAGQLQALGMVVGRERRQELSARP